MSRITSVEACIKRLRAASVHAKNQVTAGMQSAAEHVLVESRRLVPKETFALHDSGRIKVTKAGFKTSIDVIYSAPYALYVHENPMAAHGQAFNVKYVNEIAAGKFRLKDPWETWKFLEIPTRDLQSVRKAMWKGINGVKRIIV